MEFKIKLTEKNDKSYRYALKVFCGFILILLACLDENIARAEDNPEQYHPELSDGRSGSVLFHLPFSNLPETINYDIINGYAVMEGDILLGRVDAEGKLIIKRQPGNEPAFSPESDAEVRQQPLIIRTGWQFRWPDGIIPYVIANGFSQTMQNNINTAINAVDQNTNLTLRRARNGERNFVRFMPAPANQSTCASFIGMQGGAQDITLTNGGCSVGSIQHEILHAAGAWHEHTRNDRDAFVTYNSNNVNVTANRDPRNNFVKHTRDGVDIGAYDYGSIMHYGSTAFAATDSSGSLLQTLTPVNGGGAYPLDGRNCVAGTNARVVGPGLLAPTTNNQVMGQRNCMSARDITGINSLYPFLVSQTGGENWGSDNYATSIAFGDVDGDGRDEVAIARRTDVNDRIFLLDDATTGYQQLWSFGSDWGSGNYATSVAFGDVDGDGRDELGIGRRATSNARLFVVDRLSSGGFSVQTPGGTNGWGSGNYVTSVAFGDVDGDGRDEMAVTRLSDANDRWFLFDDATNGYSLVTSGGKNWGGDNFATFAAFGDIDGDGRDEFAITRSARENARYWIFRWDGSLRTLHTGGENWGSNNNATSIAFGDVDGDGRDEFGVTRRAGENERFFIFDDINAGFRKLLSGGKGWGGVNYATSIAFGDFDGDGRDEIAIARNAKENARYWLLDDSDGLFLEITSGGQGWGSSNYATGVAFGDVNSDGRADLGLSRRSGSNMRYAIFPSGN